MKKKIYLSYPRNNVVERYAVELRDELSKMNISYFDFLYSLDSQEQYIESIQKQISKCDLFIGFVNGDSQFVYFEIGIAIAKQKKVMIIGSGDTNLPLIMKDFKFVDYNSSRWVYDTVTYIDHLGSKLSPSDDEAIDLLSQYSPSEILKQIRYSKELLSELSSADFESLVMNWFETHGFKIASSDLNRTNGCDFMVVDNEGNILAVEVKKKNLNNSTTIMDVQNLLGAIHYNKASGGILVSTSDFTNSAAYFAKTSEPQIQLWTLEDLT